MIRRLKIAVFFISVLAVALSGWAVVKSEYVNSLYDISGSLEGTENSRAEGITRTTGN